VSSARGRSPAESSQGYAAGSAGYQQPAGYARGEPEGRYAAQHAEPSAGVWAGSVLAGILMILGGTFSFLAGLGAIIKGGFFTFHSNYPYNWTTRNWGWTELIVGAVVFAAGVCVMLGMMWARILGVILATLSAVASFLWLPFYPLWAIATIAVDVFIIWALVAGPRHHQRA
jgi:hypothetical protein